MKRFTTGRRVFMLTLAAFIVFLAIPDIASAADISIPSLLGVGKDNNYVANMTYGGLGTFDSTMQKLVGGFISVAYVISIIMTATAGLMVAFGLGEANRTFWNWILGAGLAVNFAAMLLNLPGWNPEDYVAAPLTSQDIPEGLTNTHSSDSIDSGKFDYLSLFMHYYTTQVILPGAKAIIPIAVRLLIAFTVIEATMKLALNLIEGDKVKFIVELLLKNGFYLFLIINWLDGMDLMQALGQGFQTIGFYAGGGDEYVAASSSATTGDAAAADKTMGLRADSIVNNSLHIFSLVWEPLKNVFGISTLVTSLGALICLVVTIAMLLLTAIEMFMARLEFYTMALLTIPLIPFAAVSQFKFLFDKALGAMINLSVKVMIIAFIQAFACKMLEMYAKKLEEGAGTSTSVDSIVTNMSILVQMVLVALIIYFLTKKIPELASGLLNGSPSLGGASMMQTARSAVNTAGKVAGAVATGGGAVVAAGAAAGAAVGPMSKMASWGGQGSVKGNLASLANAAGGYAMSAVGHGASLLGGTAKNLAKGAGKATVQATPMYKGYSGGKNAMNRLLGNAAGGAVGDAAGSAAGEAAGNAVAGPVGGAVGGVVGGMAGEKAGEAAGVNLSKDGDSKGGGTPQQKTAPKLSEQVSNAKKAASNAYQPIKKAVSNPGQTVNNIRDSARQKVGNAFDSIGNSYKNSTLGRIMDTSKRDDKEK